MNEVWAGGEKVSDWTHAELPAVGDSIIVATEGGEEAAQVTKVAGSWNSSGAKTMIITVVFTDPMPMA